MNNFKSLLIFCLAISFAFTSVISAQDAPSAPQADAKSPAEQKAEKAADKPEPKSKASQEEKSNEDELEEKKAGEEQEKEDKKSELTPDDKKTDDKKTDDKKTDDKKADDKKTDDKKADDKKADDKKADDKKPDDIKKGLIASVSRFTRDAERIKSFSKQADEFVAVFEPVVVSVNDSTLMVMSGRRQIALGTVVDSDGLILTKASELKSNLGCKLLDGTIVEAEVIGIDPQTDLALLKIDVKNLNVAPWSEEPPPATGRWLATPKGSEDDIPTIGVVSVESRAIPPSRPFIGIVMENVDDGGGVRITRVVDRSPADFADLWVNDVIVMIDEENVKDNLAVRDVLKNYDVNDRVTMVVMRGEKELKIKLTLAERDKVSPENQRSNQQNSMGSILSRRRKDFPEAFQHDSMLTSKTCGGPIVDLSGKVVGINIARAGRVSSLALPVDLVLEKVCFLKTGDLSPAIVNKEKIELIDAELEEIATKLARLPEKKEVLERKYNVEKARMEELNKSIEDLQNRLKVIEEKSDRNKTELDSVRKEIRGIEKVRQRLEADREQLRTGSR